MNEIGTPNSSLQLHLVGGVFSKNLTSRITRNVESDILEGVFLPLMCIECCESFLETFIV